MKNKLSILFLLERGRINAQGLCIIRCRMTYKSQRKHFSTGLSIVPKYWNSKKQKAFIPEDNNYTNNQLSLIKNKLNEAFLFLQVNDKSFDVDDIYNQFKGVKRAVDRTILEVFDLHNSRMQKLVGKNYVKDTHYKFEVAKRHVANFISKNYRRKDFPLQKLDMKFILDFEYYLKSEENQKQITLNKYIQRLRKIIRVAMIEGWLDRDPFMQYKAGKVKKSIVYLSPEELKKLEEYKFAEKRLQQVADMFTFCCYSGLAYNEMSNLKKEHVVKGFDGNLWIEMYRQKTKKEISIPLLPKARAILDKYNDKLPILSNQKFNSYLKEIAAIVGIEKRLTHHVARKTFATTVLLSNGISMEVVSKLLGHSNLGITQAHYGKVVQKKVSDEIKKLF